MKKLALPLLAATTMLGAVACDDNGGSTIVNATPTIPPRPSANQTYFSDFRDPEIQVRTNVDAFVYYNLEKYLNPELRYVFNMLRLGNTVYSTVNGRTLAYSLISDGRILYADVTNLLVLANMSPSDPAFDDLIFQMQTNYRGWYMLGDWYMDEHLVNGGTFLSAGVMRAGKDNVIIDVRSTDSAEGFWTINMIDPRLQDAGGNWNIQKFEIEYAEGSELQNVTVGENLVAFLTKVNGSYEVQVAVWNEDHFEVTTVQLPEHTKELHIVAMGNTLVAFGDYEVYLIIKGEVWIPEFTLPPGRIIFGVEPDYRGGTPNLLNIFTTEIRTNMPGRTIPVLLPIGVDLFDTGGLNSDLARKD